MITNPIINASAVRVACYVVIALADTVIDICVSITDLVSCFRFCTIGTVDVVLDHIIVTVRTIISTEEFGLA